MKNFEEATSAINENLCLVVKHAGDPSPVLELKSVKCEEKKSVICRTESKNDASPRPSNFPCIPPMPNIRKKRAAPSQENSVRGKIYAILLYIVSLRKIGVLLIVFLYNR